MLSECIKCNGMLPVEVYRRLFDSFAHIDPEPIIEIGTAHGAATTAMGLGSRYFKKRHKIFTVDIFGGRFSSRRAYGSPDENLQIVVENLKRAEILDRVNIFKGTSEDFARSEHCPQSISMLMLDADGRIDRDFLLYYSKLKPGGQIVIDDADTEIFLSLNADKEAYIDLKHRITSLLVDRLNRSGYITDLEMVSNTLFCTSTGKRLETEEFKDLSLDAYRELVFAHADGNWEEITYLFNCPKRARRALELYDRCALALNPLRRLRRFLAKNS